MSKFQSVMSTRPPHVVVKYDPATDQFSYAVEGSMPMAYLVGFITRVQAELAFRNPDPCDGDMCVIAWTGKKFQWFVDSKVPVDPLVGTLELVKCVLVDSQLSAMFEAAQKRAQTGLIAANGQPILKKGVQRGS